MIQQYHITLNSRKNTELARITESGRYVISTFQGVQVGTALELIQDFGQQADVYDYTTGCHGELHTFH